MQFKQDQLHKVITIDQVIPETDDFKTFIFKKDHGIEYKAGQFLTLVHSEGVSELRRSYSIVSNPICNEPLAIGVKRIDNGVFSRWLVDHAREGQQLLSAGVGGFFTLPGNLESFDSVFFFAAGSGISPIMSLLKSVLFGSEKTRAILVYSSNAMETTIYLEEIIRMEGLLPNRFLPIFLFSGSADLKKARLNRDILLQVLESEKAGKQKSLFYTCGPESYMRLVSFTLQEQGFPKEHIRKEDFIPLKPTYTKPLPPDKDSHMVELNFKGKLYRFMVNYPDTILTAAKKALVSLPYSCETGKCGNCAALCTKGKVWMSNNEVLMDDQVNAGYTLTCVGHPLNGDVKLEMP